MKPKYLYLRCFLALLLGLTTLENTSARPASTISPTIPLELISGPSGNTIKGLFGLFPSASGTIKCDPNLLSFETIMIGNQEIPPLYIGTCGTAKCPYGSDPNGSGTCQSYSHSTSLCQCSSDSSCIDWGCAYSGSPSCCATCTWNGRAGCSGCLTGDSGCKK